MRLLGLVGLLVCWPGLAQKLDINGYSAAVISSAGDDYYFAITDGVRDAAKAAGFEVIERPDLLRQEALATTLFMIVVAQSRSTRGSVEVRAYDIVTRTPVAVATVPLERIAPLGVGSRSGARRNLSQGSKALVDGLGYTGFDPEAQQENQRLLALAPTGNDQRSAEPASESR
jgi:hypothetical protein